MKRISLLLVFAAALVLSSCNKYPDGPAISLRTKKTRLANSWVVASYSEDGVDKTTDFKNTFTDYNIVINKEGNYSVQYKPFGLGNYSESGTWAFNGDKVFITFTSTTPASNTATWKIVKLKNDELWGRIDNSHNVVEEVHLVPKP